MEGAARFIKAHDVTKLKRCYLHCFSCCSDAKKFKKKYFRGKFLKVTSAEEPSLILWENLGITSR